MNIRSCLMRFAKIIGEEKKLDAIKVAKQINDDFVDLVQVMQLAVKNLCLTKVQYIKEQKIKARNKTIQLSEIGECFTQIINVYKDGVEVEYRCNDKGKQELYVLQDCEYTVRYVSMPNFYDLDEEMDHQIAPYYKAIYLSSCALWFLKKEQFTYYKRFYQEFLEEIDFIEGERSEGKNNH